MQSLSKIEKPLHSSLKLKTNFKDFRTIFDKID